MEFRPFEEADREAIHRITVACFQPVSLHALAEREYGRFREVPWHQRKLADIDADLAADPQGVFVALETGEVVGFVTTRCDAATGIGRIYNLAVDPARQGRGLGAALLRCALDHLRERGMGHAAIETIVGNVAGERLYPRLGFREYASQIHYLQPLDDD